MVGWSLWQFSYIFIGFVFIWSGKLDFWLFGAWLARTADPLAKNKKRTKKTQNSGDFHFCSGVVVYFSGAVLLWFLSVLGSFSGGHGGAPKWSPACDQMGFFCRLQAISCRLQAISVPPNGEKELGNGDFGPISWTPKSTIKQRVFC